MTIYDIAKQANVSSSTISRVINNKPGVSDEKREEIRRLLDYYHYVPSENAQNLGNTGSKTIGILLDDLKSRHQVNDIGKIQDVILDSGYYCFVKCINKDENALDAAFAEQASKRMEGVMLLGPTFNNHDLLREPIVRYLPRRL